MTPEEIFEQIHAVVCSICDRHYPLCAASELFNIKLDAIKFDAEHTAKMRIDFNHSLGNYDKPITVPVITLEIMTYPLDEPRAMVKIHSVFGIEYMAHFRKREIKIDNIQHHYINQIDPVNLLNFGMMFDAWLNMMGYYVAEAQSMVL